MLARALDYIVRHIVAFPDDVTVKSYAKGHGELLRVWVNPQDVGKVIGRRGHTANSLRTVAQALAGHPVRLDIMDADEVHAAPHA